MSDDWTEERGAGNLKELLADRVWADDEGTFPIRTGLLRSLLAELTRLREENERLNAERLLMADRLGKAQAENERLKTNQTHLVEIAQDADRRAAAAEAQLAEFEEHERQTHERLGAILGTDDSLEQCAKRMQTKRAAAQAEVRQQQGVVWALRADFAAERENWLKVIHAMLEKFADDLDTGPSTHLLATELRNRWRALRDEPEEPKERANAGAPMSHQHNSEIKNPMDEVEQLIKKAAQTEKSEDAIRFSQAALNVAHARQVVKQAKTTQQP